MPQIASGFGQNRGILLFAEDKTGIRPLIGISDLFERKQLAPGGRNGPYGCCYLPDSVLDESDFVGLEQTKKMWMT